MDLLSDLLNCTERAFSKEPKKKKTGESFLNGIVEALSKDRQCRFCINESLCMHHFWFDALFPRKIPSPSFLIFPNLLSNLAILILSWWCSYMPLTELVGFRSSCCSDEQHPTVHSFWVLALCCPWACWIQQASLKVVTSGAQVLGCLDASLCAHIGQVLSLTGKTGQIPTYFHRPKVRLN